ncbi:MAG TPA: hypothetical protein VK465_06655 [Fibrobacteria bacterium]|nr:hypothetical protein [Fibrobacteria bacterium]
MRTPGSRPYPGLLLLVAAIGLLPVLPMLVAGSPVLNNDMLVAYFCYFWDFHRDWSLTNPFPAWSSSYQTGMPMHAYWQSGYLYPVTWILFGPLSPHVGIHLFYAFHFALGIFGCLRLGPRLYFRLPASLWAGLCFSLSGTMLARHEHATFMAGWTWMPLVLSALLALRDAPGPRAACLYAAAVSLQALGGHPQASATTAILVAAFLLPALLRPRPGRARSVQGNERVTQSGRRVWLALGQILALLWCAPLVLPFLDLVGATDRFDGEVWEGKAPKGNATAAGKLEDGVFGFEKFSTGGLRPLHLLSLGAAHALGTPSNASWWGGEVWGEVFLYLGVLGLFFCFMASWRRASGDLRLLWGVGLFGLWLAFGAHLGASQVLYEIPGLNNFRRPARYLILPVLALAALSAHGFQRWTLAPGRFGALRNRLPLLFVLFGALLAAACLLLKVLPEAQGQLLDAVRAVKRLDPDKDYIGKISDLAGRLAADGAVLVLSGFVLLAFRALRPTRPGIRSRWGYPMLFAVLLLDLLRIHWDHFYLFPASFYREPPATVRALDGATRPFWRVSHYLEYPGHELWRMHNDPLAGLPLLEREKTALSHGIHAVFGYRHVSAHLPLVWPWPKGTGIGDRAGRYLLANLDLERVGEDSLRLIDREGDVRVHEVVGWKPRFERRGKGDPGADSACPVGYAGFRGLCVREERDGRAEVTGVFRAGDTLLFRERDFPTWTYRIDGGPWRNTAATPEGFLAAPIDASAHRVEWRYLPEGLYRWSLVAVLGTLLLISPALPCFRRRFSEESIATTRDSSHF